MEDFIKQQRFWEARWQAAAGRAGTGGPGMGRSPGQGSGPVERWNKMAGDFAERTGREGVVERRDKTIRRLVEKKILKPGTRVLDIGAGPGSWALSMAKHCAHITALEPARGMTDLLAARIKEEGVDNISIVRQTWQAVDLGKSGWEGAFDLVFASMTPGIDGPESLKKMVAASRSHCYMSAFSGKGMYQQFAPLWKKFFNMPMPGKANDIIYPFNLLYAMGFRPDMTFTWWNREINWSRDHAVRHFMFFFESHMEMSPEAAAAIEDYVDARCLDGEYRPPNPICQGAMTWSVHKGGDDDA